MNPPPIKPPKNWPREISDAIGNLILIALYVVGLSAVGSAAISVAILTFKVILGIR